MKLYAHNGSLADPSECGSFTVVARQLNNIFKEREILSQDNDSFVIVPECLDVQRKFAKHIPFLASEYSNPPHFVSQTLKHYDYPVVLAISEFAKKNLIQSGIDPNKIFTAHLGSNDKIWYPLDLEKEEKFTFLTVNSSNDRSGFEVFIPEFIEFANQVSNVQLIIKDGKNPAFKDWIRKLNCPHIKYIDDRYNEEQMRILYSTSHVHVYYNHTTSFGMTSLDAALCGCPALCTFGSALKEFIPAWTQPFHVTTNTAILDSNAILGWQSIGLNTPPQQFYPFATFREELNHEKIAENLHFAYNNYDQLKKINQQHQIFIKNNLNWNKTVDRIIEILNNYV